MYTTHAIKTYIESDRNAQEQLHATPPQCNAYSQSSSLSSSAGFLGSLGLLGAWLVMPDAAPTTS